MTKANDSKIAVVLTIAGSDPSGGAGIQADLKTFHQFGVYGMSVITLITVQNTCEVKVVNALPPNLVAAQLEIVLQDIVPQAAKIGALGTSPVIEMLAEKAAAFSFPLVIDPVMISKHGQELMREEAREVFVKKLLPRAYLVTPNIYEAAMLTGRTLEDEASIQDAAKSIADFGAKAVMIKGGHLKKEAADTLYFEGKFHVFSAARMDTPHTHGTGCTYSAAITAALAKGMDLVSAVGLAKKYITRAIETNPGLGKGFGPVNHWAGIT